MIRLYRPTEAGTAKTNGSYTRSGHGLCVLTPSTCTVREIAGGEYVLTMVHPYDPEGKWMMLAEDYIITAPVPKTDIRQVRRSGLQTWGVYGSGGGTGPALDHITVYSSVMTAAKQESFLYKLFYDPMGSKWSKKKEYRAGDYVWMGTSPKKVYRAKDNPEKGESPEGTYSDPDDNPWEFTQNMSDYTPPTDDGVVSGTIYHNEYFFRVADFDIVYMYIVRADGRFGFVKKSECEKISNSGGGWVADATTIEEQDFRIYRVDYDDDAKEVTVQARHVSYDIRNNALYHCELNDESVSTAAIKMLGKTVNGTQPFRIITNISDVDVDADWSFMKLTTAILDPKEGLAGIAKAKVIRDNTTFYLLENEDNNHGFELRYGGNLLGVRITRDIDDVVTAIMPVADDGYDGHIFLDDTFWTSSRAGDYAFQRIEVLQSEYYVGQEIEKADGTTQKLSEANVKSKMLKEAKKRFTVDKADLPTVTIDVDFLLLGDTEEYKQFRGLQRLNLYDTVKVTTGPSQLVITAQVTEIEYDAILKRYNSMKLGTVYRQKRGKVASYMLTSGGVSYRAIAPALKKRIKGAK